MDSAGISIGEIVAVSARDRMRLRTNPAMSSPAQHAVAILPTSTGGVTVGDASAYWVVLQSPAAAPQFEAKVQGGVLTF